MDKYEIIALSKDKWKGTIIPMTIRSDSYYDFEIRPFDKNGCRISMVRKPRIRNCFICICRKNGRCQCMCLTYIQGYLFGNADACYIYLLRDNGYVDRS